MAGSAHCFGVAFGDFENFRGEEVWNEAALDDASETTRPLEGLLASRKNAGTSGCIVKQQQSTLKRTVMKLLPITRCNGKNDSFPMKIFFGTRKIL